MLQIALERPGHFIAREAPEPTPQPGEALVRIHRIGVCGTDLHAYVGRQPFFIYPRVLGHELGVEVVATRGDCGDFRPGDPCAVEPYLNCGRCIACRHGKSNCCTSLRVLGVHIDGGMQPLLAVPAAKLHRSHALDYDRLALVETLAIGAHAVERAQLRPDERVLVVGAGPIGLSVIQFALAAGARVIVMDVAEARRRFVRDTLGVAHTLAGGPQALDELRAVTEGDLPTAVFDATGNAASMAGAFDLAAHGGRIVFVGLFQGDVTFNDPNFHRRELTLLATRNALPSTFAHVIAEVVAGRIDTRPWITHRLPLAGLPTAWPEVLRPGAPVLKAMISVT